MKQKNIFLDTEGDAWFERNHYAIKNRVFDRSEPVIESVYLIANQTDVAAMDSIKILEIGCGEAARLAWISENLGAEVYGVEPSIKAVEQAQKKGVHVEHGTADQLPFESEKFDIAIFGFCLYLCDREDLHRIAQEADRVLKRNAWLIIHDFFAPKPIDRDYHHKQGVCSFKMDYRKLFDWHPAYTCYLHRLNDHGKADFTDAEQEWVSISVLRKKLNRCSVA